MKSILFAALAIVATVAPLHAKKIKSQTFKVAAVTITTVNGKLPAGAAKFTKGSTVSLKISPQKLTGPKKINLDIETKSIVKDSYRKGTGVLQYTEAVVRKNTTTKKPISVDLTYFGPVKIFDNITAPGQVVYTLVAKKPKKK